MLKRSTKYILYKLLSLFSVIRGYNIIVIAIAQYLASIFILGSEKRALDVLLDLNLFLIVLASSLAIAGGYIINNFYDSEKDLINRPNKTMLDRVVSQGFKLKVYFGLNFLSAGFAFIVSWHAGVFFSAYIFWLWFYSHKLKKIPFIGNISAALGAVLPFFGILMYFKEFNSVIFVHASLVILLVLIRELIKDLTSIKGDLVNNYRTIPVVFGEVYTKRVIHLLSLLTLLPVKLLLSYFNVGYMFVFLYFAIILLFIINVMLLKTDGSKGYKKIHFLIKILILIGIFSILLIDPNVILHGKQILQL